MKSSIVIADFKFKQFVKDLFGLASMPDWMQIKDGVLYGKSVYDANIRICEATVEINIDIYSVTACVHLKDNNAYKDGEECNGGYCDDFVKLSLDTNSRTWTAGLFGGVTL